MSEETAKNEKFPGLSVERFRTTVEALSKLWDSGKFLFFLPRRNWLRIVGDSKELEGQLNEVADEGGFDEEETIEAREEVRLVWGALLQWRDTRPALRMLENYEYEDFFDEADEEAQGRFREFLREKFTILEKNPLGETLKRRARRLETTTVASVEELDVEVIKERRDELENRIIESPFARLRFRYSRKRDGDSPFGIFITGPRGSVPVDSFELECDQSDIDLLIKRLIDAKKCLSPEADEPIED